MCKKNLKLWYVNNWKESMENSSKCSLYKEFKTELSIEKYLLTLNKASRQNLIKYRLSNHKLPI